MPSSPTMTRAIWTLGLMLSYAGPALASEVDGTRLSVWWGAPFAGLLLSIAVLPLVAPHVWHHHFGKISAAWALAFLLPFALSFGPATAAAGLVHAAVAEYIPFIILLTALFVVAGGIHIRGNLHGSPGLNTAMLAIFYLLDSRYFKHREEVGPGDPTPDTRSFGIDGPANLALLLVIVALVLMSGLWRTPLSFSLMGTHVGAPGLVRDIGLLAIITVSMMITPASVHSDNQFTWAPMQEVAKLFAAIFLTIVPVIAMLKAGTDGPFDAVVSAVTHADGKPDPAMYFWATGILSAFLDNAPTYLVFFNTAGGDPDTLMGPMATTLTAISAGAVFMGANSYIGNAPNLMVKAVAEDRGVPMPSFFGYMAWSCAILVPLFGVMTLIFFR